MNSSRPQALPHAPSLNRSSGRSGVADAAMRSGNLVREGDHLREQLRL
jgi:hypothetical protein